MLKVSHTKSLYDATALMADEAMWCETGRAFIWQECGGARRGDSAVLGGVVRAQGWRCFWEGCGWWDGEM